MASSEAKHAGGQGLPEEPAWGVGGMACGGQVGAGPSKGHQAQERRERQGLEVQGTGTQVLSKNSIRDIFPEDRKMERSFRKGERKSTE